jgi:hypothetical protein
MCDEHDDRQAPIDILIGNQVPLYREVLEATLLAMRPTLLVQSVPPEELDNLVCRLRPAMVICSSASTRLTRCVRSWIILYPDERDEIIINSAGMSRTIQHASVAMLLDVLDDIVPMHQGR